MQYEFLKNFPKRMKNVGLYGVLIQNSIQKTSWKQFGFLKFDEQMNLIFAVMLYIMEQSWKEVSRNSGGEGFLSAFVILSSLLYYMRRDDTDIFADKNEGKVLIMDNPFAQTNASHLLIPLMDMAKKSNTQFICLTDLGGESIYNRFDNIYVLNLIAASLRGGTQYLKAEHKRGKEPDELVTARIEVGDQMELLF
ncbi:MAG: hypothetical protein BHV89_08735 [Clostridiales bacterium 41_21_two_genomes]|nr:MAG: hypothetical protein BHV89_08735 [Clostridiales bacterium 41_21_two_genomes]